MIIVDLGAAPGSWSQYVSQKTQGKSRIIALDILPMDAIPCVENIQGDFTEDKVVEELFASIPQHTVDLVLSDMAPNMSGMAGVDIPKTMYLAECALDFGYTVLKPGGTLLMKVFHGQGFDMLVRNMRETFHTVLIKKPKASRDRSRETYILAQGYKKRI